MSGWFLNGAPFGKLPSDAQLQAELHLEIIIPLSPSLLVTLSSQVLNEQNLFHPFDPWWPSVNAGVNKFIRGEIMHNKVYVYTYPRTLLLILRLNTRSPLSNSALKKIC